MNPSTFNFTGTVQTYNVTMTGTYTTTAIGAGGGAGGNGANPGGHGAEIGGTFTLTAGQNLNIIVGGQGVGFATGLNNGAGAGGFSKIYITHPPTPSSWQAAAVVEAQT